MNTQLKDISPDKVGFEMRGDVAILRINNPPVNAGSHGVRAGLADGIVRAAEFGARAAIVLGDGRCFVAGSDLREFNTPLMAPELPDVIRTIEDAPFPVVAAMHGVALGGGLELALGCDYRVATAGTQVGLPEVSLGFVPGAGGTQRMPRLVGVSRAIELVCAAQRVSAETAIRDGLIDAVIEGDLLEGALAFVAADDRTKRRVLSLAPPPEDESAIDAAADRALRRGKGRPNVAEAIRLIRAAGKGSAEAALSDERAVFQDMRVADDAFALRYLFFAERRAATIPEIDLGSGAKIGSVGVVGGGTMGQGIVGAVLASGLPVTLVERDDEALLAATDAIAAGLDALVGKGRLSSAEADSRKGALTGAVGYEALSDCDLVIEAVFEDMAVKKTVLKELEAALGHNVIIATNTSYLDIDEMASGLAHPTRVLGLHFFSPADVMPLLEVVRAQCTSNTVLATSLSLARKLGKQAVVARVAEGFIGNRIYAAYRRRAELFLLDGASPQQVDTAMTEFGFAMGPFAVADMSGLDIAWAMRKRQAPNRDPRARYAPIADTLCEAGRFGRKTGKGWYAYPKGKPLPDPEVDELITKAREAAGISPATYDAETIQRQLMAAIVNEAALLEREGIAQRPSDVDVVLTNGYGFPRWRGGPLYWAARQSREALQADFALLADAIGHGFCEGPVGDILDRLEIEQKG